MKDYHPIGVARDTTGKFTHFLLKDERESKPHKPSPYPTVIVDAAEFDSMITNNKVQLFIKRADGQLEHAFTEEEVKAYKKGIRAIGHLSLKEYFSAEAVFDARGIVDPDAINFSLVLVRPFITGMLSAVTGAVYMRNMPEAVRATLKRNSLFLNMTAADYAVCNWELSKLLTLFQTLSTTATITCNGDTLLNPHNPLNQVKSPGFRTPTMTAISMVRVALSKYMMPEATPMSDDCSTNHSGSGVSKMSLY